MVRTDGRPTISSPGPRIAASEVDFRIRNEGTISLLWAVSDDAVGWVAEHLTADDIIQHGGAVVIGHRYVEDILNGIDADGLVVGRAS